MERLLGGEEEAVARGKKAVVGAEGRFHQVRGEQLVSVPWSRHCPTLVPTYPQPWPCPGPAPVPPQHREPKPPWFSLILIFCCCCSTVEMRCDLRPACVWRMFTAPGSSCVINNAPR